MTQSQIAPNPLRMPGATLITRLQVYDTVAPDGQIGGTPHFHFLCSEMYFVLAGSGAVEVIDANGFKRVELAPYSAFVFSPGTIHRLINPNRDLELLVIMQNSGLPERGDNIVTFEDTILQDDEAYASAMRVTNFDEAYVRRDRGVQGFLALKAAFDHHPEVGKKALMRIFEQGAARTRQQFDTWRTIISNGAVRESQGSLSFLESINTGDMDHLFHAQQALILAGDANKPGFCGRLNRYFDPATLQFAPEGVSRA